MTTRTFKMATSAIVGVIVTLGVLFYTSTQITWGLAAEDLFFYPVCMMVFFMGFMLSYCPQDIWERFNPTGYQNFVKKITSSFVKFSDEITRYED